MKKNLLIIIILVLSISCTRNDTQTAEEAEAAPVVRLLSNALLYSGLPMDVYSNVQFQINHNPDFTKDVFIALQEDRYLRLLADKWRALSSDYEPDDLVYLRGGSYETTKSTMTLRKMAADSLEEMAAAMREEGLTLLVSSAYRAFLYQALVYRDNVIRLGQEAADRLSARPGTSQHQLGLALDFGSIDDDFSYTAESIWLAENASRFGWSLSYPDGYEQFTGYKWESWHYRYVGRNLSDFIDSYFNGIQQFALRFLHEFEIETARFFQ